MSSAEPRRPTGLRQGLFWLLLILCLTPLLPGARGLLPFVAPGALIAGIALALSLGNPYPEAAKKASRILLQVAVILLGFSVDLNLVLAAGRDGLVFALLSITAVFGLGWILQKAMKLRPTTSLLVSTGTAICGGSAIAAMSSVLDAPQEDISVSVGTVFLLNAVALLIFPPLGHALALNELQFGTWSGIAIHDVSSVVGAATSFGGTAVDVATAVKLSRVLYLIPIVLLATYLMKKTQQREVGVQRVAVPWFIGGFVLASIVRSSVPGIAELSPSIKLWATCGFAASLFLIGAGISRAALRSVGTKPLIQGVALWVFMSVAALAAVRNL